MTMISERVGLQEAIDSALRTLLRAEHRAAGSYVTLPVRYPSGASVVLQITEVGDRCFVTDYGMGYQEAELFGGTRQFERRAVEFATAAGIRYDGRSFFVAEVVKDRLPGAMVVVADCSQRAAAFAALRAADRQGDEIKELAFDRIRNTFGRNKVERDVPVRGSSTHPWPVDFVVKTDNGVAIFEATTPHPNSVASVTTKLGDIARLESAPPRIVVVRNKRAFGDLLGVVAPVASVVLEVEAANDLYLRYAKAA